MSYTDKYHQTDYIHCNQFRLYIIQSYYFRLHTVLNNTLFTLLSVVGSDSKQWLHKERVYT